MFVMVAPLKSEVVENRSSHGGRAMAPFPTHHQNRHRGLTDCGLPCNADAPMTRGRSLSGSGVVGGFCFHVKNFAPRCLAMPRN